MDDLAERLRQIESNPSPDLWDEITSRPVHAAPPERRGPGHRIAAGLVAAIVSFAALAFLVTVFRSGPDRDAVVTPSSPLTIRVRTTNDPFDVHFSATFRGEEIDLVDIETPGPDLEYPDSASVELPVGTPVLVEASGGISASVFELDPAQGKFVVEDGSCLIPGSLQALPGPGVSAFFIYAEGKGWSGGQAFRVETVGDGLDHDSALDPNSTVDASKLGLATCDVDPSLLVSTSGPSGDDAGLSGTLATENGCVAVATAPASSVYVVWPAGYSLADEGGETWLVDDAGNQVARIGDQVQMGGGITNLAHAEPSVQDGIPAACETGGPDAYWFAGTPELVLGSPISTVTIPNLTGMALVEALGLESVEVGTDGVSGPCDGGIVELDGVGYCIPRSIAPSDLDQWRVAQQVRGHIPSDAELAAVSARDAYLDARHDGSDPKEVERLRQAYLAAVEAAS